MLRSAVDKSEKGARLKQTSVINGWFGMYFLFRFCFGELIMILTISNFRTKVNRYSSSLCECNKVVTDILGKIEFPVDSENKNTQFKIYFKVK